MEVKVEEVVEDCIYMFVKKWHEIWQLWAVVRDFLLCESQLAESEILPTRVRLERGNDCDWSMLWTASKRRQSLSGLDPALRRYLPTPRYNHSGFSKPVR